MPTRPPYCYSGNLEGTDSSNGVSTYTGCEVVHITLLQTLWIIVTWSQVTIIAVAQKLHCNSTKTTLWRLCAFSFVSEQTVVKSYSRSYKLRRYGTTTNSRLNELVIIFGGGDSAASLATSATMCRFLQICPQ